MSDQFYDEDWKWVWVCIWERRTGRGTVKADKVEDSYGYREILKDGEWGGGRWR